MQTNKNKKYSGVAFFYAGLYALFVVAARCTHFCGNVSGSWQENTIRLPVWRDLLFGIAVAGIVCVLFSYIFQKKDLISSFLFCQSNVIYSSKKSRRMFWYVLIVLWLPYFLTFAPGTVFEDSLASIYYPINSNLHPVLYSLYIKLLYYFGVKCGFANLGIYCYTFIQYLSFSWIIAYLIDWIYQKKVRKSIVLLLILFFGLFPVFPAYAITVWKDPMFSAMLFLLSLFLLEDERNECQSGALFSMSILVFAVCFLRNNGILIIIPMCGILLGINGWKRKSVRGFLCAALTCLIIQYPVYKMLGIGTQGVEAFGVPLQQVSYVVVQEKEKISPEQWEIISHFFDVEKLNVNYTPCIVDSVKWGSAFYAEYFEAHRGEFVRLWFSLLPEHLGGFIKAWLLETLGFWHPYLQNDYGYMAFGVVPNSYGIFAEDLIKKCFGFSLSNILPPLKIQIGSGTLFWIALWGQFMSWMNGKRRMILFYAPQLICWLWCMIGTPVAFSLRYVFVLLISLPLNILLPFLPEKT